MTSKPEKAAATAPGSARVCGIAPPDSDSTSTSQNYGMEWLIRRF